MTTTRWLRLLAALLAVTLVAAACGDDDEDDGTTTEEEGEEPTDETEEPTDEGEEPTDGEGTGEEGAGEEEMAEGVYDLGGEAVLDTNECPGSWDPTEGLTDEEIRIGISLPQSGALAGFGTIAEGMQVYFDNAEPIDGRSVTIVARDDGYEPARTNTNVEEMIDTEDIFAFSHIIGSPNNLGVRDLLNEECIPQLFAATGLPAWGDPANYPFTSGALIPYNAESLLWCDHLAEEIGEGGTVAGLFANNDFGQAYQEFFETCAPEVGLEIIGSEVHDPNADTVANEVTTLAATGADAFVVGTTGAACPQAVGTARGAGWDALTIVSATCQNIGLFWNPLADAADGIRLVTTAKEVADPRWADDETVQTAIAELEAAGIDPLSGSYGTGYTFAESLDQVLRAAAASDEGLNRATLMQAMWQADATLDWTVGGSAATNGTEDAYWTESGEISELEWDAAAGTGTYVAVSDLIDREGELGSFEG